MDNGHINEESLKEARMNIPLLLSQLRRPGYANVHDVEFAVLETTGQISVIPKSQMRPVRPKDLGIQTHYEGLPLPLVIDGEIQTRNMEYAKLSEEWLQAELQKMGFSEIGEISLAEIDTGGRLYVDFYHAGPNKNLRF